MLLALGDSPSLFVLRVKPHSVGVLQEQEMSPDAGFVRDVVVENLRACYESKLLSDIATLKTRATLALGGGLPELSADDKEMHAIMPRSDDSPMNARSSHFGAPESGLSAQIDLCIVAQNRQNLRPIGQTETASPAIGRPI
jgi:hypothetical protein